MIRAALALALPLLVAASTPGAPSLDQVNEAGRVLATLNDVRVFVFALMFLLFLQTLERWWAGFRADKNAKLTGVSADKLSDAVTTVATAQSNSSKALEAEIRQLALEVRELTRGRP